MTEKKDYLIYLEDILDAIKKGTGFIWKTVMEDFPSLQNYIILFENIVLL